MYTTPGFDNEKYLNEQTAAILERAAMFGNKLYLEFGGKLLRSLGVEESHAGKTLAAGPREGGVARGESPGAGREGVAENRVAQRRLGNDRRRREKQDHERDQDKQQLPTASAAIAATRAAAATTARRPRAYCSPRGPIAPPVVAA